MSSTASLGDSGDAALSSPPKGGRNTLPLYSLGAVLVVLWALLLGQLVPEWELNPQYAYGWLVPLLAGYLFWQAWERRPSPGQPERGAWAYGLGGALLVLFLPVLLIQQANPDWRLVSWIMAMQVVGLSLVVLYLLAGRPWLRHFAFPVLFFLIAVPWPTFIEQPLVQGMMQLVARVAVEIMVWIGIPAEASGNVIYLSNGVVGIDEACSGVRSLQSVLMASLFMGELFRLRVPRRVALLGIAVLAAFLGNLFRSSWLVWIAANHGMSAIEHWHDTAGYSVLAVSLAIIFLVAWWWKRPGIFDAPAEQTHHPVRFGHLPAKLSLLAIAWLVACLAVTEGWYRLHEQDQLLARPWSMKPPTDATAFETLELPETTLQILRADSTESVAWREPGGKRWSAHFFRWEPGRNAAQLARLHRPDVCLPASGAAILPRRT